MPFEPRLFQPDAELAAALRGPQPVEVKAIEAAASSASGVDPVADGFLSAELEALAEQLSEDSGHLAQCYPAVNPRMNELRMNELRMNELMARTAQLAETAQAGSDRGAGFVVWAARCGLAASLLLAVGIWWQNGLEGPEAPVTRPVVAQLSAPAAAQNDVAQQNAPAPDATLASHTATEEPTPMLDPQVFLELDAASQAAVADLVQEGELDQSSLSL